MKTSLTGIKPKGTRPVSNTGLMTAARIVLVIIALIVIWIVVRGG